MNRRVWLVLVPLLVACPGSIDPVRSDTRPSERPWQPIPDVDRCGPEVCAGCCRAGQCITPSTDTACGEKGAACVDCTLVKVPCVRGVCCQPACQGKTCGQSDGCGGTCESGSGCTKVLLEDQFDGAALDSSRWSAASAGGGTVSVSGGELLVQVPAQTNAWAEAASKASFPVGAVFEARVFLSSAQFYDHRGVGFASGHVGADCNDTGGGSHSAQWRGQDEAKVAECKNGTEIDCQAVSTSYPGGWRTIKIVRRADRVEFYENGVSMRVATEAAKLPSSALPVRFSAFTYYSAAPGSPITIRVDWVKVTLPPD